MIVLENVGVAHARKIDQGRPPRKTHCHAERELMGRGYVNYFWRQLEQRRHRAARRFRNRTAYRPCDPECFSPDQKAAVDVLWVVLPLSCAHLKRFPATPPR